MVAAARQRALHAWATLVYWTGKVAGVLVAETVAGGHGDEGRRHLHMFTAASVGWPRWVGTRVWNVVWLTAVVYRVLVETWPETVRVTRLPGASCYDTVCEGVWCVYACVYYGVAWLDRTSEACALLAAVTWRRQSTVQCLNSAAAGCFDDDDDDDCGDNNDGKTATDVPWHAYLAVAFPVIQFAVAANAMISHSLLRGGVWSAVMATAAAFASCAPVAAHGTAAALLIVATNSMRSINDRIARLSPAGPRGRGADQNPHVERLRLRTVVARLSGRHWRVAELVTGGVCGAYGVDLMTAVLLVAVRVTYVAVSVFHGLTDNSDARTNVSPAVVCMQLMAWFGQFAYLMYTCDELAAQSSELFDNLNSLLLDIFENSRLSGETYSSRLQDIEAVQEFIRQVVVRKVFVHACGGLIMLNLSLITTIIGVTLTYFIVQLQFESSNSSSHNNTISQ